MKKTITRIWGVGLILVLMVSLLLSAAPVSAKDLKWGAESIPDADGKVILAGDISDLAVATSDIVYAAVNGTALYRSSNRGETWSKISLDVLIGTGVEALLVAVAPDDPQFVAIADYDSNLVYISEDSGAEWDSLGTITASWELDVGVGDAQGDANIATIRDLAVSAESAGKHYVAVAGTDNGSMGNVFYFDVGASVPAWTTLNNKAGWPTRATTDVAGAVEFSPNFASDKTLLAVSAEFGADKVHYSIFSYSSNKWNSSAGHSTDFPVDLRDGTDTITALDSASIAPDPEFLGSDDSMCIAFVGITVDHGLDTSGIWRLDYDDADEVKKGIEIHSVAFDGTNLVAGHFDKNTVRRSADPLATEPTVKGSAGLKSPGLDTAGVEANEKVVVAWAGSDVVAGTSGNDSAFAVSRDNGKTFNDISLIDALLTNLRDVAVSADGSNVYLSVDDGTDFSLWRLADGDWEKVLAVAAKTDFMIRVAPDDVDVVYVADKGSTDIYYSADAGEARWQTRSCKVNIQDLAVETDGQTVYAVNTSGSVSKSVNSGFTWASSVSSKYANNMLISLGEDLLLAGSTGGQCSYSADGNSSWSKLEDGMTSGDVVCTASGLDDGDFVYAAVDTATDTYIYRWEIGEDDEWGDIHDGVLNTENVTGIALMDGSLYAVGAGSTNATTLYHSLVPTKTTPSFSETQTGSTTVVFGVLPGALRVSSGKLWAIDLHDTQKLYSYNDTVSAAGPELSSPGDDLANEVNPITGKASDLTFSFVCPSDRVTSFDIEISLDSGFDDLVIDNSVTGTPEEGDRVWQMIGPNGATGWTVEWMPETTYYWHARVSKDGPIRGPWSETRTITIGEAVSVPPVTVEIPPTPEVTVTVPAPEVTVTVPPMVTVPPAPAPVAPAYIWGVIIIGALLVIALIVLIIRTRRVV